ncbi:glycosyltransferase family 9 protein [Candidatus Saganbacteria bacterium]|nr:glycosyltransferase family 9 protein [Candidatus Saganbacteria bacterium]
MRILIVKLGAIGDVLRTTSVLAGLRDKYPDAELDWLTAPSGKEILLHNQYIDNVCLWAERVELDTYDLVIGLEDELEVGEFVSLISKDKIIGAFAAKDKMTYTPSAWFDMSAISRFDLTKANYLKQTNRLTFQQHMSELLGVDFGPYVFQLTSEEIEDGERVVRSIGFSRTDKFVGINTGAGKRWQLKSLGMEKTIALIKKIQRDLGMASLILGGADEQERNAIISGETGMPNAGVHALRGFAGIINTCHSLVSSDSLAMHFAIALQKKLVAFFGPTSPYEIELYGFGEKVVPPLDCRTCYKKTCARKPNCMEEISVNELFEAVKRR